MSAKMVKIMLLFFFIKHTIFNRGFMSDVYMNKKLQCTRAAKDVFTVSSEIECSHRYVRRNCNRLIYNMERGKKRKLRSVNESWRVLCSIGSR